jgi:hypothetical protein
VRLPGAYRSLPRPSSALKPSHPPHSVVTSKVITVPTAGVGAYTWLHHRSKVSSLGRLCPSPPTFLLGVARLLRLIWVEHEFPRTFFFSKEVIRPQVPLRPPCYDLTLLARPRFETANFRPFLIQTSLGWFDGQCVQGAGTYSPHDDDVQLLGIPCS